MSLPCCAQAIKSPNVLIKKGDAKVADVGLSQLLSRSFANSCSFGVGTFSWAATELLLGSHPVSPCPVGQRLPPLTCMRARSAEAQLQHQGQPFPARL